MRCVEFHGRAVSRIEASWWLIKLRGTIKRGWYVKVYLRDETIGPALCAAMEEEARQGRECMEVSYEDVLGFAWVRIAKITQRSGWIAFIIAYLARAGHLDRNQELTAYASFGLAYESPV